MTSPAGQPTTTPSTSPRGQDQFEGALEKTIQLLQTKDDTSRFAGLALLRSLLDNHAPLRNDAARISRCWTAISPKFLDRLLRSRETEKKSRDEAESMRSLAISVIHTFTLLLPDEARDSRRYLSRSAGLVAAIPFSSPASTEQILQTLLTFTTRVAGAEALLHVSDLSPLLKVAQQQPLVSDVVKFAFINGLQNVSEKSPQKTEEVISQLQQVFLGHDAVPFFDMLTALLPFPLGEVEPCPTWLGLITMHIRDGILIRPSFKTRQSITFLSSALLETYPHLFPSLLFQPLEASKSADQKPFSYLFINLLLFEIRSTFPEIHEKLASPEYATLSRRLAAAFSIVATFIAFLIRSVDTDEDTEAIPLELTPDLLLKLRRNMAETMSLTIEFLRDRWDGAVSGAAGLDPSARQPSDTPLSLTWESQDSDIYHDDLILYAVRALSLWLREDDSESLRNEAAGITDVLVGLFTGRAEGEPEKPENHFQSPVTVALEGTVETEAGIEAFEDAGAWKILWTEIKAIVLPRTKAEKATQTAKALYGTGMVRVLLTVAQSHFPGKTKEEWMDVLAATEGLSELESGLPLPLVHLYASWLELAMQLYNNASLRNKERHRHCQVRIAAVVESIISRYKDDPRADEIIEIASDIIRV
ncbi:MAG: hypothetical protein M1825_005081 [Sarcosagium campestre]|nr:MAG: hypothetical protein M1825_005081 [Sarcosagium campestre]